MSGPKFDVKYAIAPKGGSSELLRGEIDRVSFFVHDLKASNSIILSKEDRSARIFVVCRGQAAINRVLCDGRGLFAFAPLTEISITAISDSSVLEIRRIMEDGEALNDALPYFVRYDDAVRYREDCKSEKTVSRMLLCEGIIPGVALGSVETYGRDSVEKHSHPFCDQLFFSFEENDMEVLIDGMRVHMGGNTLLHIPLGSSHGIDVHDGGCAHYVWIDFILDERGVEYMNSAHKKI